MFRASTYSRSRKQFSSFFRMRQTFTDSEKAYKRIRSLRAEFVSNFPSDAVLLPLIFAHFCGCVLCMCVRLLGLLVSERFSMGFQAADGFCCCCWCCYLFNVVLLLIVLIQHQFSRDARVECPSMQKLCQVKHLP